MKNAYPKFALVGTLLLLPVIAIDTALTSANEAAPTNENLPWDERAVSSHLDIKNISGKLTPDQLKQIADQGESLFDARFTSADGVGRPMATQAIIPTKRKRPVRNVFARTSGMDANACSSCHNLPLIGGAGGFVSNVFVSEGFQQADFDTTDPQFSNERNTNHLFGSGLVELLAREMSAELARQRTEALNQAKASNASVRIQLVTKGVDFGYLTAHPDGIVDTREIDGIDTDLIIKPFTQKGVITSLRQFTINALNHHHGMQADERFGARWTGSDDFDEDKHLGEISSGDVSALVLWQASLAPPTIRDNINNEWKSAAERGQNQFSQLGCVDCHKPYLPLDSLVFNDPGPLDLAGTLRQNEVGEKLNAQYDLALLEWAETLPRDEQGRWLVPLFGDLKRHVIADSQVDTLGNELLSQRFVERNVFMTSELWGIASTAPYGHRGNLTTLSEVISAHGGEGRQSRDDWMQLSEPDKNDLIAYLKTLVIEP
jgi:hypothetical protein